LGLARLVVTSDGEVADNPAICTQRTVVPRPRAAGAGAQAVRFGESPQSRSSVAVLHRRVRRPGSTGTTSRPSGLVRDNQAVYREDQSVAGLARMKLARSVHDAGWSTQAAHCGEGRELRLTVVKVGRDFRRLNCAEVWASRRPKPLAVRA
jgi:putative transposase